MLLDPNLTKIREQMRLTRIMVQEQRTLAQTDHSALAVVEKLEDSIAILENTIKVLDDIDLITRKTLGDTQ